MTTTEVDPYAPLGSVIAGPLDTWPVRQSILTAATYTDPEIFGTEQRTVFAGGWVWAGFSHWVAGPGDVRPVEVAGRPLLLTRDEDGTLRVFENICPHRGIQLVEAPDCGVKRIQCPYHFWSFTLDGSLANTPFYGRARKGGGPDEQTRAQLALSTVAGEEWAGMVFVNLSGDGSALRDLLGPLATRWAGVDFSRVRPAAERVFEVEANWKLVVENFLDFYHLPFVHPQVGPPVSTLEVDDLVLSADVIGGCYPRGAQGKADKTEQRLAVIGAADAELHSRQDIFCVFPNALLFLEADWFQVIALDPVAADRTVEHMVVFVDEDSMGDDLAPARDQLSDVLFHVNEQDLPILAKMQQGKRSPATDRTTLVPTWDQVTAYFQVRAAAALEGRSA